MNPKRPSYLPIPPDSPFPIGNLPFGCFVSGRADAGVGPRIGVAIGDDVLDAGGLARDRGFAWAEELSSPDLNAFMALGRQAWDETREWLTTSLTERVSERAVRRRLQPRHGIRLEMPVSVADYVDFYSSATHATNVGRLFRPGQPSLPASWHHLPIGYHGRAGSVVVSGTPLRRPRGQRTEGGGTPVLAPTARLDFEVEVGFFVGVPSEAGGSVSIQAFAEHVFGACLVNDWSARDILSWEYVPLGPFLGKSFLTTISPWIVPLAALQAARISPPAQDPTPLGYLCHESVDDWGLDLRLEVEVNGHVVSRPRFSQMYWTPAQQLAHLTVNGAALRTGDLFASGAVSSTDPDEWGSMLELSWGGTQAVPVGNGATRTFLEDGDEVVITGRAPGPDGQSIGFGEATGIVHPAPIANKMVGTTND